MTRALARLLGGAGVAVVLLGGCGADAAPVSPPAGLTASLVDEEDATADGMVEWRTSWRLSWDAVPGADGYVARWSTSEGAPGDEAAEPVGGTTLELEVAAGTSSTERLEQDRDAGVLMTSSQLAVSVAATGPDGQPGPWSEWVPVGDRVG